MQKLLTQLEKAGLVSGAEGVKGGWRLARDPAAVTVLEVADAAKGDDALFQCREIRARCALWDDEAPPRSAVSGVCTIHAVMLSAEAAMRRELASHTLADIARTVLAKTSPAYPANVHAWFEDRYVNRRNSANTGGDDA